MRLYRMPREGPPRLGGFDITNRPQFTVNVIERFPKLALRPRSWHKKLHPIPALCSDEDDNF